MAIQDIKTKEADPRSTSKVRCILNIEGGGGGGQKIVRCWKNCLLKRTSNLATNFDVKLLEMSKL